MYNTLWYPTLTKPPLTPPAWVFAPAWTILYTAMLIALITYIVKPTERKKGWGIVLFFAQLLLNFCWSPIFFNMQNIAMAFAVIIMLDIFVIMTIIEFSRVSKTAGYLLVPYLIWIFFATYLNAGFLILN